MAERLTFTGQLIFFASKRSEKLINERIAANKANWVEFGPISFASTASGLIAVGIVDVRIEMDKNEAGGEASSARFTLLGKLYDQLKGVNVWGVQVVIDLAK